MKKLPITLTTLLLFSALLIQSCGGNSSKTGEDTANEQNDSQNEAAVSETTADPYLDDLPGDLKLGGKEVTFLYREEVSDEFYTESLNGDIVNDAVYESIREVEERLDTDIVLKTRAGQMLEARQEYKDHITNTVLAGDALYDWVDLMFGAPPGLMVNGIFTDLNTVDNIDLEKPYYIDGLSETVSIDDHLYFLAGDISLGYLKCLHCMYFNKQTAENYGVENLYDIVNDGQWTIEKMREISEAASEDINGDGKYNLDDKIDFLVHNSTHLKGFWMSTGIKMYEKNEDGEYSFIFGSDRDAEICSKLNDLVYQTKGSYYPEVNDANVSQLEQYNKLSAKFVSGAVFITTAEMDYAVTNLRDMEDAYGILPYPKMDEEQENYISSSRTTHNSFCIPITCSDTGAAGAVMEALSSVKYSNVAPAYFEIALKVKYSHDDESAVMYDLIRDTMYFDFGYTYNTAIDTPEGVFTSSIKNKDSIASNVASRGNALQTSLDKYIEQVREGNKH